MSIYQDNTIVVIVVAAVVEIVVVPAVVAVLCRLGFGTPFQTLMQFLNTSKLF